eukprot:g28447.t1
MCPGWESRKAEEEKKAAAEEAERKKAQQAAEVLQPAGGFSRVSPSSSSSSSSSSPPPSPPPPPSSSSSSSRPPPLFPPVLSGLSSAAKVRKAQGEAEAWQAAEEQEKGEFRQQLSSRLQELGGFDKRDRFGTAVSLRQELQTIRALLGQEQQADLDELQAQLAAGSSRKEVGKQADVLLLEATVHRAQVAQPGHSATQVLEVVTGAVRSLQQLSTEVHAQRTELAATHMRLETDSLTKQEFKRICNQPQMQEFYYTLYTELNQLFVGAVAAASGLMTLDLGSALEKNEHIGKMVSTLAVHAGAEVLRGIPFASVVGAAVKAALDFRSRREKKLEVRNIAWAVQRSHDVAWLARRLARRLTMALERDICEPPTALQSEQAWSTQAQQWRQRKLQQVKDWVSRVKFCVLETLSGVYRSPAERLAAEKAMEVAGYLIAGSCSEAQTVEQVVELLLELVGPGPQLPPPAAAAAATSTVEMSGGASSASGLSSSSLEVVEVAAARQESLTAARRDSLVKRAELEEMLKSKAELEDKLQSVTLQLERLKQAELDEKMQSMTLEFEKMKNEMQQNRRKHEKSERKLRKLEQQMGEGGDGAGQAQSTVKQAPGDAKLAELVQREVGRHQAQLDEQGRAIQKLVDHNPQVADELQQEAERARLREAANSQARRQLLGQAAAPHATDWSNDDVLQWLRELKQYNDDVVQWMMVPACAAAGLEQRRRAAVAAGAEAIVMPACAAAGLEQGRRAAVAAGAEAIVMMVPACLCAAAGMEQRRRGAVAAGAEAIVMMVPACLCAAAGMEQRRRGAVAAGAEAIVMMVPACLCAAGLEQRRRAAVAAGTEAIDWSNDDVVQWLRELKLHPYKISEDTLQNCREHNIDGRVLLALDGEGLKELGIYNPLLRAKLLAKIRELDKPPCPGDLRLMTLHPCDLRRLALRGPPVGGTAQLELQCGHAFASLVWHGLEEATGDVSTTSNDSKILELLSAGPPGGARLFLANSEPA